MKKFFRLILILPLLMISSIALAIPAQHVKKTITLADGSQKEVVMMGDENLHFYVDAQNNAYICNTDGVFVKDDLARLEMEWSIRMARRNEEYLKHSARRVKNLQPEAFNGNEARLLSQTRGGHEPFIGQKKGLVLLVNFQDCAIDKARGNEFYNRFFNEVGFNDYGNYGSVHDYFNECSYGQFDLSFDVYGPFTLSRELAYYGHNESSYGGVDIHDADLAAEACSLAYKSGADFSKYDWDGDGVMDNVFIICAGYGENRGAPEYYMWPHAYWLEYRKQNYGIGPGIIELGGIKINQFVVANELDNISGNIPNGIGVACHEFAHCLGLPDFYNTGSGASVTMNEWDLMDSGNYLGPYGDNNSSCSCPTPFTSYERMFCGWLKPTVLNDPCRIKDMKPLSEAPESYIIFNDNNPDEYYMLENRQKKGFGSYNSGHGMLILHVCFNSYAWKYEEVNRDPAFLRMTIIPADNDLSYNTQAGDPWPGTTGNRALTDMTTPAARLKTVNSDGRKYMDKPIEDIEESDEGYISFTFNGGNYLGTPVITAESSLSPDAFTANWTSVAGASGYQVQLKVIHNLDDQQYPSDKSLLTYEDFCGFNNGGTVDGTDDVANYIYNYASTYRETGQNLYTTPYDELKIGSNGKFSIVQPVNYPETTEYVTLSIIARSNDLSPHYLSWRVLDTSTDSVYERDSVLIGVPAEHYVFTIPAPRKKWTWLLSDDDNECYISEMAIIIGGFNKEETETLLNMIRKPEKSIVNTSGTYYDFSGLSNERKYYYSVRAVNGSARSCWSSLREIVLPVGTSVVPHTITESGPEYQRPAVLYDMMGRSIIPDREMKKGALYINRGEKMIFE